MYVADFGSGRAANARSNFNGDAFVNTTDMALWMQGVRPEGDAGDANEGGNSAE